MFFILLATSLLSPLASNKYLPEAADFSNHTGSIIQAKMALNQGQFPIRTLPWEDNGWGNAWYQFYSPSVYMLSAEIYQYLTPQNPYVAFKIMLWLALFLGGIYTYRLAYWLIHNKWIAILTGALYMMSPYFLVNINARAAFTEAIAQGIIPLILYYSFRLYFDGFKFNTFFLATLAWFFLITSHLITFFYASLFIGLFFAFLSFRRLSTWKNLFILGGTYLCALLLSSWYLVPVLLIEKKLSIAYSFGDVFLSRWITPLETLLSPNAISPMPIPGNGSFFGIPLYVNVGWPILMAIGVIIYYRYSRCILIRNVNLNLILTPLLILFSFAFLMTWSPVDFWQFLPKILAICQFSYRLLSQVMWIGVLLFAIALSILFQQNFDGRHFIVGMILLGLSSSSSLPTEKGGPTYQNIITQPDVGYGQAAYLVTPPSSDQSPLLGNVNPFINIYTSDHWLITGQKFSISYPLPQYSQGLKLHIEGNIPIVFKKPVKLTIKINNATMSRVFSAGDFIWDLPINNIVNLSHGHLIIEFIADRYFIPGKINANSSDFRQLTALITKFTLTGLPAQQTVIPVEKTNKSCALLPNTAIRSCQITVLGNASLVQLPVIYYPNLLDIRVNGASVSYTPTPYGGFLYLATLKLAPGYYHITSYFRGLWWANWISAISWIGLILGFIFAKLTALLLRRKKQGNS